LLSGDNDSEKSKLVALFNGELLFNQTPQDKLDYIKEIQKSGRKTIMIGDGLNDSGALMQSEIGIAVTDDINNFSPACDVILKGNSFILFDAFLDYCKNTRLIINTSFALSILYNIIGLYFAVTSQLQPVVAAILMPASSVSIVLLTTAMSSLLAVKIRRSYCTISKIKTDIYQPKY